MLSFTKTKQPKEPGPQVFRDGSLYYSAERTLELIEKYSKKIGKRFNDTHTISGFFIFPYGIDLNYILPLYMENKIEHQALLSMYPSEKGFRLYMVSFDSYRLTGYILLRPFQMIFRRSKMKVEMAIGPSRFSGLQSGVRKIKIKKLPIPDLLK